jgi:hypothetical protein
MNRTRALAFRRFAQKTSLHQGFRSTNGIEQRRVIVRWIDGPTSNEAMQTSHIFSRLRNEFVFANVKPNDVGVI